VRRGRELSYYSAEGREGEFVFRAKIPFGDENLAAIRLVAATGGPSAAIDVRATDLHIRAATLRLLVGK
jgi:hypothetical protein